jgi:hypothetical protein
MAYTAEIVSSLQIVDGTSADLGNLQLVENVEFVRQQSGIQEEYGFLP